MLLIPVPAAIAPPVAPIDYSACVSIAASPLR